MVLIIKSGSIDSPPAEVHDDDNSSSPDSLSSSATVTINVLDSNDNRPQFTPSRVYSVPVEEDEPVGSLITSVSATDLGKEKIRIL